MLLHHAETEILSDKLKMAEDTNAVDAVPAVTTQRANQLTWLQTARQQASQMLFLPVVSLNKRTEQPCNHSCRFSSSLEAQMRGLRHPLRLKPGKLLPGLYRPLDAPPEGPGNDDFQGVCTPSTFMHTGPFTFTRD